MNLSYVAVIVLIKLSFSSTVLFSIVDNDVN